MTAEFIHGCENHRELHSWEPYDYIYTEQTHFSLSHSLSGLNSEPKNTHCSEEHTPIRQHTLLYKARNKIQKMLQHVAASLFTDHSYKRFDGSRMATGRDRICKVYPKQYLSSVFDFCLFMHMEIAYFLPLGLIHCLCINICYV